MSSDGGMSEDEHEIMDESTQQDSQQREDEKSAVNALVRLIVFTQSNSIIKQEDINKKIIQKYLPHRSGRKNTSDKLILSANTKLMKLFSMELFQLNAGEKGPKAYSKVSTLDPHQNFTTLVNTIPPITLPAKNILTLTLCLIFVHEFSITQEELFRLLSKLGIEPGLYIQDLTPYMLVHPNKGSIEHLLVSWVKEGYIVKNVSKGANKCVSYSMGDRAKAEFPVKNLKLFMIEFFPELSDAAKKRMHVEIGRCSGKIKKRKPENETREVEVMEL